MKLSVELTARHNAALVCSILLSSVVLLQHTSRVLSICHVSSQLNYRFIHPSHLCPHPLLISVILAIV